MARAFRFGLCQMGLHGDNPVVGEGRVIVTCKKNRPEIEIPGVWNVRVCRLCLKYYSSESDRIA